MFCKQQLELGENTLSLETLPLKELLQQSFPGSASRSNTEGLKLHLVLKTVTLPSSKSGKKLKLEVSYQTNLQYSSLPSHCSDSTKLWHRTQPGKCSGFCFLDNGHLGTRQHCSPDKTREATLLGITKEKKPKNQ